MLYGCLFLPPDNHLTRGELVALLVKHLKFTCLSRETVAVVGTNMHLFPIKIFILIKNIK